MTGLGSDIEGCGDAYARLATSSLADQLRTVTRDPRGARRRVADTRIPGATNDLRYNQEFRILAALPRPVLPQLEAMTQ